MKIPSALYKQLVVLFLILVLNPMNGRGQAELTIQVTGIRTSSGQILYSLYNGESGFPDDPNKAYRKGALPVKGSQLTHTFTNLPAGSYAISLIHDVNGNNKLDKNKMGIPTEGCAFSNNAMGAFGPPKFNRARFTLLAGKRNDQVIRLRHFK